MPPYTVVYSRRAQRDLRRLDPPMARRITAAIDRFAAESIGDVRPLTGRPGIYRLRVGDWRVLFTIDHEARVLTVARIVHRSAAYG